MDVATWSKAGQLDWWVRKRQEWWGRGLLVSATYRLELASFAFVGEVVLMVWLLVFAVRSGSNQMINR